MNTNNFVDTQNNINKNQEKSCAFSLYANAFSFASEMEKLQPKTEDVNSLNTQTSKKEETNEEIEISSQIIEEDLNQFNIANMQMQNVNLNIFKLDDTFEIKQLKDRNNTLKIDLTNLGLDDIKLFDLLNQNTPLVINNSDGTIQNINLTISDGNGAFSYKSFEISKTIMNAIETASKTNKPLRLDFGQDTSVVLRIGKDGKLSADFIPNDKAMETILKNALPELKAKFEEENIPYNQLNYRNPNQNNKQNNQKKENKEDE